MLYLKCSCGRMASYLVAADAKAAGWTWTGRRSLVDVTCAYCRTQPAFTWAVRRHTSKHGTVTFYLCRLSDGLPITANGRPVGFVQGWAAFQWARQNGFTATEPLTDYADVKDMAPEAVDAYAIV